MNPWSAAVVVCWSILLLPLAKCITLEEAYKRCQHVPRPDLEPCLLQVMVDLQPLIVSGIPELELDPNEINVEDLHFDEVSNDNYIRATFSGGRLKGFHEMDVTKLKIDYNGKSAEYVGLVPEFFYTSHYFLDARFLFFPLQGNGTCWFRVTDLQTFGTIQFDVTNIEGQPRFQGTGIDFDFNYGQIFVQLNNLFNADPILQETGRMFINQNKDIMLEELKPSIRRSFGGVAINALNRIMRHIKIEDLAGHEYL